MTGIHVQWKCKVEPPQTLPVCRALDGDVVAVELLPESQWKGEKASLPQPDAESTTGGDEEDGDDPEGGHIAQVSCKTHISIVLGYCTRVLYQAETPRSLLGPPLLDMKKLGMILKTAVSLSGHFQTYAQVRCLLG